MEPIQPESLLMSYFEGTLDEHGCKLAEDWYNESEAHRKQARDIYRLWYATQTYRTLQSVDTREALRAVDHRLRGRRRKHGMLIVLRVAACVILVTGIALLWQNKGRETPAIVQVAAPEVGTGNISLVLSDRHTREIPDQDTRIRYENGRVLLDSTELHLDRGTGRDKGTADFNQLIVPAGKRSFIVLPDSSEVWVNSGSRLVFPPVFASSRREVYVEGEIFLHVKHDETRPFIVRTRQFAVEVLGTSFHVSAYGDEQEQNVVLVSGKVKVEAGKKENYFLAENEMFDFNGGHPLVRQVDPEDYISWINGVYRFRSEGLAVVAKKLSRYYGRKIVCAKETAAIHCSGKLELRDSLEEVLENLKQATSVRWEDRGDYIELLNEK